MCGIAGIIHRDGPGDIGAEMSRMLQSMKHRGPDSSGFALYGPPSDLLVMRIKLADPNETRGFGWSGIATRSSTGWPRSGPWST